MHNSVHGKKSGIIPNVSLIPNVDNRAWLIVNTHRTHSHFLLERSYKRKPIKSRSRSYDIMKFMSANEVV